MDVTGVTVLRIRSKLSVLSPGISELVDDIVVVKLLAITGPTKGLTIGVIEMVGMTWECVTVTLAVTGACVVSMARVTELNACDGLHAVFLMTWKKEVRTLAGLAEMLNITGVTELLAITGVTAELDEALDITEALDLTGVTRALFATGVTEVSGMTLVREALVIARVMEALGMTLV